MVENAIYGWNLEFWLEFYITCVPSSRVKIIPFWFYFSYMFTLAHHTNFHKKNCKSLSVIFHQTSGHYEIFLSWRLKLPDTWRNQEGSKSKKWKEKNPSMVEWVQIFAADEDIL